MLDLESDVYGITMAGNIEFQKGLLGGLAKVHRIAESNFLRLRGSLETKIKALESKIKALESKARVLEMQNVSLKLQIEKHLQEDTDLAQYHQQALTDLMARSNVKEENNQSFEQRLALLEKQLSATARIESSDNAGGTTELRTKGRCSELDRNPQAKRKYNNNIEHDNSRHGTFGMVLRSQTKGQVIR